jgi:hypothetical protein
MASVRKPMPSPAKLDAALRQLASWFADHAAATRSPLDKSTAEWLAFVCEFRERPNYDAVRIDVEDGLGEARERYLVQQKRARPSLARRWLKVSDVAALLGWSKGKARRWLNVRGVRLTRFGNADLIDAQDVSDLVAKTRKRRQVY